MKSKPPAEVGHRKFVAQRRADLDYLERLLGIK